MVYIMKKTYLLLVSLLCISLSGCEKDDCGCDKLDIMGNWVVDRADGVDLKTNDLIVYKINSNDRMKECFRDSVSEQSVGWTEGDLQYALGGDLLQIYSPQSMWRFDLRISNLSQHAMEWKIEKGEHNGEVTHPSILYHLRRLSDDYTRSLVGLWEGACITQGELQEVHRWEYFSNGTYLYYSKNEQGEWPDQTDKNGTYVLTGDVLVTSWHSMSSAGEMLAKCEVWIMAIDHEKMSWRATREDGKIIEYVMTKVQK